MGKNSFLLYTDNFKQITRLSMEQRGILFTALFAFQLGEPLPEMDPVTEVCFSFLADDIERNNEKYDEIIKKRKAAGALGGKQKQANLANAKSATNEYMKGVKEQFLANKQMLANARQSKNASTTRDSGTDAEGEFVANKQTVANVADNDNDNVNDKDNDTNSVANLANATDNISPEAMADLMEVLGL